MHERQRQRLDGEQPSSLVRGQTTLSKSLSKPHNNLPNPQGPLDDGYGGGGRPTERQYAPPPVPSNKVVSRPAPRKHAGDPRKFQIEQVKRRFSPSESAEDGGTALAFRMAPSDPDFPYEMTALDCVLHVPTNYTKGGKPSMEIRNKEMDKGYRINVERGFDSLVERMPVASLLALINALDRNLEAFLMAKKADTIKIVPNARPKETMAKAENLKTSPISREDAVPIPRPPSHLGEQIAEAQHKRDSETRRLEARLGRLALFAKDPSGQSYTVPIDPRDPESLPVPLQAVKAIKLCVPPLYPLEPCTIEILGVSREAAASTEQSFTRHAKNCSNMNLMGHINFLTQNMHGLAIESVDESLRSAVGDPPIEKQAPKDENSGTNLDANCELEREHIIHIPRPPEWTAVCPDDDETSESDLSDLESHSDEAAHVSPDVTDSGSMVATSIPERGISINFPGLELHSVELLTVVSLALTVKCLRCKCTTDISGLVAAKARNVFCTKCASSLNVTYRPQMVHANANRAGYLDMDGCTVVDMLPSNFVPTCSQCSGSVSAPGIVAVRGPSAAMAICRECHQKLSFKVPEVKFLQVSASVSRNLPLRRKVPKEQLGILAGTPLPHKGRCKHYAKSYRWFRFSCCNKVYPCDKCHDQSDASKDHPNEHANRMICGYCSREQNFRPEDCGICRMVLIGKSGSGFREGGKGTRDKVKMSRRDPRKYKRRGPGAPVGGVKG